MKKILQLQLLCALIITAFSINAEISSSSAYNNEQEAQEAMLAAPIVFTVDGINEFLQITYNNPNYSTILANDFAHMSQCLVHGIQTGQKADYAKTIIRLFTNKLKETNWTNAYAIEQLLAQLPHLINPYFIQQAPMQREAMHDMVYKNLYSAFEERFADFKNNPEQFLHDRSQEILSIMQQALTPQDQTTAELRSALTRFIDLTLNRLIWSPQHPADIWPSIKSIAHSLNTLFEKNIITDPDDLDDMSWSLVHRFNYFLDLQSADLSQGFFNTILQDLETGALPLFELAELDDLILQKKQYLRRALKRGITKAKK